MNAPHTPAELWAAVRPKAPADTRWGGRWLRLGVVAVAVLYLILLGGAWTAVVLAGDVGIVEAYRPPEAPDGLTIVRVQAGSPADRASLRAGDVILTVNGLPASHQLALPSTLSTYTLRAGDPAVLRVQRATASPGAPEAIVIALQPQLARPTVLVDVVALTMVGLLFMAVAVVVALARPDDPAARLLFVGAGSLAVSQAFAMWGYGVHDDWVDPLEAWPFRLACAAGLHLFLAFPAPQPVLTRLRRLGPTPLRRLGGGTALLYIVPLTVALALRAGPPSLWRWWDVFLAAWLGAALLALSYSYRHPPTPLARAQLRWIFWAMAVGVTAFTLWIVVGVLPRAVMLGAAACFPIAVGVAILRYRLWDIDLLINRTLVYGMLTGTLVLIYVGSVVLLQRLFRALTGQESELAIIASTLAIAALFQPLRRRIQTFIDRRFYRRTYDAAQILTAFSATLRSEVDVDKLRENLLAAVQETMQPTHVSLWLRKDVGTTGAAGQPEGDREP